MPHYTYQGFLELLPSFFDCNLRLWCANLLWKTSSSSSSCSFLRSKLKAVPGSAFHAERSPYCLIKDFPATFMQVVGLWSFLWCLIFGMHRLPGVLDLAFSHLDPSKETLSALHSTSYHSDYFLAIDWCFVFVYEQGFTPTCCMVNKTNARRMTTPCHAKL